LPEDNATTPCFIACCTFILENHAILKYFEATVELMNILARACGHAHLNQFCPDDLTTWKRDIAYLTGVNYAGVIAL